jgi:type IV pilus assembly protein PilC
VPIIGNFKKKTYLTRFSENLSVLIAAGLPITQALKITKDIIDNNLYQVILEKAEERVSRGEKISAVLSAFPQQFPPFVTQMVYTGEETGRLDDTLMNVVRFYQEEITRTADNLASIIEPVLIVFLGIGIAVLAVALFVPLFQLGLGGGGG